MHKYSPEGQKFMSCITGANGDSNLIDHAEQEKHKEANRLQNRNRRVLNLCTTIYDLSLATPAMERPRGVSQCADAPCSKA